MNLDQAVLKLQNHLNDSEAFSIRHDGTKIIVDVFFIYRMNDIKKLGNTWEGHPIVIGRRSCW